MTGFSLNRRAGLAALFCLGLQATGAICAEPLPVSQQQAAMIAAAVHAAEDQGLTVKGAPGNPAAAAIALAGAQHGERIRLTDAPREWAIRPAPYDGSKDFAEALASDRLKTWLDELAPPDPRYARLAAAYARYRALEARGGWPRLPPSPTLKLGDTGPAVEALRARLSVEDPQTPQPAADAAIHPPSFDAALAAAVTRAQGRYGLEPDGRPGPGTLAALNVPVTDRLLQLRANLERWRWAPRRLPAFRVEVNTADATLELVDGGAPPMIMRAIVGRAGRPTPMFTDAIKAVIFNPPWNVPSDIAAKEIWPKIRRDPGYKTREGFVERAGGGLQQLPGPKCALGAVKFDLSNPFGVYLHDTPARSLFALDRRALSHGCMRLADPMDLAKRLLADDPAWPETQINLVLLSGKTTRVPLRTPAPVFVFYWTAFVGDDGQTQFRPDIYSWDRDLALLLARSGQSL